MAGRYNTEIRDYCGEESSIAKLSNHFSKDFAFRQDGINNIGDQNVVPTSFNFNYLLNDALNRNTAINKSTVPTSIVVVQQSNEELTINKNSTADQFYPTNAGNFEFPHFNISHNVPMNRYVPPDPALLAEHWAEDELSKFDSKMISEDELIKLSEESINSKINFLDVVRNLASLEEQNDIDIFHENTHKQNYKHAYDLEEDLKSMREKIDTEEDTSDTWKQIEKSIMNSMDVVNNKNSSDFIFNKSNPYLKELQDNEKLNGENVAIDEMLEKGIKLYKEGYFAKASLVFEAIVQMKPQFESGWSYLCLSLSENEQDHKAMIACKKCLELNKNNREVLLSLARVYCNEMNLSATISCLEQWLLAHPRYSDLVTVGQQAMHSKIESQSFWDDIYEMAFESSGKFEILAEQLNAALIRNSDDFDPELEMAAGTLYHAVQDYDRSTECFEAAVKVVKDNASLWNKLGTSYCNSGNYEKSIDAYQKALELAPGFARAQCNLGVAYYNMESYRNSIEHAIKAYKIQHTENPNDEEIPVESDPIWTLIRMSSFKLDRADLDLVIFNKDIDTLAKEFGV